MNHHTSLYRDSNLAPTPRAPSPKSYRSTIGSRHKSVEHSTFDASKTARAFAQTSTTEDAVVLNPLNHLRIKNNENLMKQYRQLSREIFMRSSNLRSEMADDLGTYHKFTREMLERFNESISVKGLKDQRFEGLL